MFDLHDVDRQEVYRYMGIRGGAPDENVRSMTEEIINEVADAAVCRSCSASYNITVSGNSVNFGGMFSFESRALARHLDGCFGAFLYAATLGSGADRVVTKYSLVSPAKAVAAQAAATAMLEMYADADCLALENAENGVYLRPRFSPGYGDFDLKYQKKLIALLSAEKNIGLCLTRSKMLTPIKSITAVIGKTHTEQGCTQKKCSDCNNRFCVFRKS